MVDAQILIWKQFNSMRFPMSMCGHLVPKKAKKSKDAGKILQNLAEAERWRIVRLFRTALAVGKTCAPFTHD